MDSGKSKMDSTVATGSLVAITLLLPFSAFTFLDNNWKDLSVFCSGILFAILSFSATMLWTRMFLVISKIHSSSNTASTPAVAKPVSSYPHATAIIAGDLNTELENLILTSEAFFDVIYPGKLEVIIAYSSVKNNSNSEKEDQLKCLIARMPDRFILQHVENELNQENVVNTAAQLASGEFITIFFAGHYPTNDCIIEAYKWRETQNAENQSIHVESNNSTWNLSSIEISGNKTLSSLLLSKFENISAAASEFFSLLKPNSNGDTLSQILARSDLSLSSKSLLVYEYLWERVFPWIALQMLPVVAFLLYKNSEYYNINRMEMSQIAANMLISRY